MTTAHAFYYLLVVLLVTALAYLYTSEVDAPTNQIDTPPATLNTPTSTASTTPTDNQVSAPEIIKDISPSTTALSGSSWRWKGLLDADGEVVFSPRRPEAFMLEFTEVGISSRTDCNTVGGVYQVEGSTLVFGELMSTLMFCEDSDESIYVSGLRLVEAYEEQGKNLNLFLQDGTTMVFESRIP